MRSVYEDIRTSRDFLAAGVWLLALTGLLVLASAWYLKPRRTNPLPPVPCRITYIREGPSRLALAPIHFSLPTKIGFSRTVQPRDPRIATTLGARTEDIRFLPRESGRALPLPPAENRPAPVFQPLADESPVFAPVPAGELAWKVTSEPMEGTACAMPPELEEAARWPAEGAWSAVLRLEAGADGRVSRVFVMPPLPDTGVTARLVGVMKRARLEGNARECRVKISRVQVPVAAGKEGATP